MRIRHATCGCGQLRLTCEGEPVRISMCHCLECQRRTGSAFGVQARFARDRVTKIEGRTAQFSRVADSGKRVEFRFCPACGSTVYWEAEAAPELISVAVGAFADPHFPPPEISVWERRRHSWAVMPAVDLVRHSD